MLTGISNNPKNETGTRFKIRQNRITFKMFLFFAIINSFIFDLRQKLTKYYEQHCF